MQQIQIVSCYRLQGAMWLLACVLLWPAELFAQESHADGQPPSSAQQPRAEASGLRRYPVSGRTATLAQARERHLLMRFISDLDSAQQRLQALRKGSSLAADQQQSAQQFDYAQLERDVLVIQAGVEDYLSNSGGLKQGAADALGGVYRPNSASGKNK
ncbi:MAG: RAQPRD family integrative conjugative element protein [Gammaproteobacteria bacterium]